MFLLASQRKNISIAFRLSMVTLALTSCSTEHDIDSVGGQPASQSRVSSVTIPIPDQLQPYLGEEKINSLRLRITPSMCDDGIEGTRVDKFIAVFGANSPVLAKERLKKGCTYALALSLGKANSNKTDFQSIYLTNDTQSLWTTIQVGKSSDDRIQATVRVFPTNDGKATLGLPGDPINMQSATTPEEKETPNQSETEIPDNELLGPSIPGSQNQQHSAINWKVVMMASDQSNQSAWISAFDNARKRLLGFFQGRGVAPNNIRQLSLKPQQQSASVQAATTQNFTSAVANLNANGPRDACLIFMTSHGSRDGFNIGSSRLRPSALEAALNTGCGNRPTVLLVSACYSGLYTLDSSGLKKPNRIILTASRSDRTSFGCSPENEFTYWDGCLIENLPKSSTFKSLASNIQSCIARKEAGMTMPSLPQAFIGGEVENLKIPGSP